MLFVLIAAIFSSSMGTIQPAQAASACEGEVVAPDWNTTAQRMAVSYTHLTLPTTPYV